MQKDGIMTKNSGKNGNIPVIGMCLWLLSGGKLVDRIQWIANNGFTGVSLLQNIIDADEKECIDAAAD